MKRILWIVAFLLPGGPAAADHRPAVEWSSWVRLGYGRASPEAEARKRGGVTSPDESADHWELGGGVEASLPIAPGGDVRLGAWGEARTASWPVAGVELVIGAAPAKLDMFFYEGEGILAFRAGGNRDVTTAAVTYGYRCPWDLWGPWEGATRYMIGVRFVASATRSNDNPEDWTVSFGLETEPVGALRYLLGIRDWY